MCLFSCLLPSACVNFGSVAQQPGLDAAELHGTWLSSDGSSITFTGVNSFAAARIDYGRYVSPSCGLVSGSGTWEFINSDGQSVTSTAADTNLIGLFFATVSPAGSCGPTLQLASWDAGSDPGLCLQIDPDTPCTGYVFDKRLSACPRDCR